MNRVRAMQVQNTFMHRMKADNTSTGTIVSNLEQRNGTLKIYQEATYGMARPLHQLEDSPVESREVSPLRLCFVEESLQKEAVHTHLGHSTCTP
jgi:hypothetical protein